jgi:hypothetical protein
MNPRGDLIMQKTIGEDEPETPGGEQETDDISIEFDTPSIEITEEPSEP